MTGHRVERVADLVHQELARVIREDLRDPRLGFVTVTGVRLSADLKYARVYISVMGDEKKPSLVALEHAAPFIRRNLGRRVGLRHTPELRFMLDSSLDEGLRVEQLLDEAAAESPAEDGTPDSGFDE